MNMINTFSGRAILPANLTGRALVSLKGFNAYASFYNSLHDGADSAECVDSGNPDLLGKNLDDRIICVPKTVGSTSAGAVWHRVATLGLAPKAMLFAHSIDSLAASGLLVADIWAQRRICTVDRLGDQFLQAVQDGDWLEIYEDGTVKIFRSDNLMGYLE
jgi:predicted aconitase with swiveling domain